MYKKDELKSIYQNIVKQNQHSPFYKFTFSNVVQTYAIGIKEAAMSLEAAGADAVGINCSVGPDQLVSVIRNIKENVSIPVIAKPNAGMPQIDDLGNAVYSMTPADFAGYMKVLVDNGASVIGGCCGTTPEFISETAQVLELR